MPESRRFELHKTRKTREMTKRGCGMRPVLTLLSDEFDQGDEPDIRRGNHGMVQQDSTESAAIFITEDDRAPCT